MAAEEQPDLHWHMYLESRIIGCPRTAELPHTPTYREPDAVLWTPEAVGYLAASWLVRQRLRGAVFALSGEGWLRVADGAGALDGLRSECTATAARGEPVYVLTGAADGTHSLYAESASASTCLARRFGPARNQGTFCLNALRVVWVR